MTKIIFNIDGNSIYFEAEQHSSNVVVCAIISTMANVLASACRMANIEPVAYKDGHVKIVISDAEEPLISTFMAVKDVMEDASKQFRGCIKMY